jgi:hypothetical protein
MTDKSSIARPQPIPRPPTEYMQIEEGIARKTSEQNMSLAFEQAQDAITRSTKETSLSLRRFQFLLMGAG